MWILVLPHSFPLSIHLFLYPNNTSKRSGSDRAVRPSPVYRPTDLRTNNERDDSNARPQESHEKPSSKLQAISNQLLAHPLRQLNHV